MFICIFKLSVIAKNNGYILVVAIEQWAVQTHDRHDRDLNT